jgi:O-acetyl-ADP-ribose deacetylase (regulator of RNase III)
MIARTVGQVTLELVQGDITRQAVDAVVNAANTGLKGGGGVDGAIHRAGGPSIMEECRKIGSCKTGDAVVTSAGLLPAKYVIHTVGPVWSGGKHGEPGQLASAYRRSLERAVEKRVNTLAFPSISTGVYSYPVDQAAHIALRTIVDFLTAQKHELTLVRCVLFDRPTYDAYVTALNEVLGVRPA